MTRHYQYILAFALLFTTSFPAVSFAAAPVVPGGLCIETPEGIQCAVAAPVVANPTIIAPKTVNPQNFHPGYYMLVGPNDGTFTFDRIKGNPDFLGVKKVYTWKKLEPAEGQYDFSQIESDLAYLQSIGKRLWIEIRWTTWTSAYPPESPSYMWRNSKYGCDSGYYGSYARSVALGGWLLCSWNANVQARVAALYNALGSRFNSEPYFEGLNVGETSTGYPGDTNAAVWGYSATNEANAFKANALAAKRAFPSKTVVQQINYAAFDLTAFASWLVANGIGLGTPDVYTNKPTNSVVTVIYPLMKASQGAVPIAPDVQWSNYVDNSTALGDSNVAETTLKGAITMITPHYLFWENREPFLTDMVVPSVRNYGMLPAAKAFYNSNK